MSPSAAAVLAETLRVLPARETTPLVLGSGATPVAFSAVGNQAWLERQLDLRGSRWRTDDRRVQVTLWWYSASIWFQAPAVAALVATGRALSPLPDDVALHALADGRVVGATSSRVLDGPDQAEALGVALAEALHSVVPRLAAAGGMRERPLWAVAVDSLANRFLAAGRAVGDEARGVALTQRVAEVVGPPLPVPRWVDVVPVDEDGRDRPDLGTHRFVRRASCCLLCEAPEETTCGACPRRRPAERSVRLQLAAAARVLEP